MADTNWCLIEASLVNRKLDKIESFNEVIKLDDSFFEILLRIKDGASRDFDYNIKYIGFRTYDSYSDMIHNKNIVKNKYKEDGSLEGVYINMDYMSRHIKTYDEINKYKINKDNIDIVILFDFDYYGNNKEEVFGFVSL